MLAPEYYFSLWVELCGLCSGNFPQTKHLCQTSEFQSKENFISSLFLPISTIFQLHSTQTADFSSLLSKVVAQGVSVGKWVSLLRSLNFPARKQSSLIYSWSKKKKSHLWCGIHLEGDPPGESIYLVFRSFIHSVTHSHIFNSAEHPSSDRSYEVGSEAGSGSILVKLTSLWTPRSITKSGKYGVGFCRSL